MPNETTLKLACGGKLIAKIWIEVRCDAHGTVTTWGALDPIQRLALEEGIDTTDELPCLLAPKS